jgi:uncharacterized membrane protein
MVPCMRSGQRQSGLSNWTPNTSTSDGQSTMADAKANSRLEAFSDGVFAIAITLLIIDVRLPAGEGAASTAELWRALAHLAPSVFAFLLSFAIVLITWVNHHATLDLINRSSPSFVYANGFLLLTIVFIPFPTELLGTYLLTDHAAPAVVLYNAESAAQAIGWILLTGAALNNQLAIDDKSTTTLREVRKKGHFAFVLYSGFSIMALWFPIAVAVVTTLSWVFWLALSIRLKQA